MQTYISASMLAGFDGSCIGRRATNSSDAKRCLVQVSAKASKGSCFVCIRPGGFRPERPTNG